MQLKALRPFTYATRRLQAGDLFDTRGALDARLLIAIKKAEAVREPGRIAPPPAKLLAQIDQPAATAPAPPEPLAQLDHDGDGNPGGSHSPPPSEDLTALRAEYFEKIGKRPFNGWDADTLRERISAFNG